MFEIKAWIGTDVPIANIEQAQERALFPVAVLSKLATPLS
jgi:hypothetical protein